MPDTLYLLIFSSPDDRFFVIELETYWSDYKIGLAGVPQGTTRNCAQELFKIYASDFLITDTTMVATSTILEFLLCLTIRLKPVKIFETI